nr:hypothetical protein [Mesorhizobium sp.]
MKRIVLVLGLGLCATQAGAGDDQRALLVDRMAEAMAVDAICPTLAIDAKRITLTAYALGYRPSDLMRDAVAHGTVAAIKFRTMQVDAVCRLGEAAYGIGGSVLSGWLVKG